MNVKTPTELASMERAFALPLNEAFMMLVGELLVEKIAVLSRSIPSRFPFAAGQEREKSFKFVPEPRGL